MSDNTKLHELNNSKWVPFSERSLQSKFKLLKDKKFIHIKVPKQNLVYIVIVLLFKESLKNYSFLETVSINDDEDFAYIKISIGDYIKISILSELLYITKSINLIINISRAIYAESNMPYEIEKHLVSSNDDLFFIIKPLDIWSFNRLEYYKYYLVAWKKMGFWKFSYISINVTNKIPNIELRSDEKSDTEDPILFSNSSFEAYNLKQEDIFYFDSMLHFSKYLWDRRYRIESYHLDITYKDKTWIVSDSSSRKMNDFVNKTYLSFWDVTFIESTQEIIIWRTWPMKVHAFIKMLQEKKIKGLFTKEKESVCMLFYVVKSKNLLYNYPRFKYFNEIREEFYHDYLLSDTKLIENAEYLKKKVCNLLMYFNSNIVSTVADDLGIDMGK